MEITKLKGKLQSSYDEYADDPDDIGQVDEAVLRSEDGKCVLSIVWRDRQGDKWAITATSDNKKSFTGNYKTAGIDNEERVRIVKLTRADQQESFYGTWHSPRGNGQIRFDFEVVEVVNEQF